MYIQVPPPPPVSDVKFEIMSDASEGAASRGDRAGIYKRLQSELIQQMQVSAFSALSLCVVCHTGHWRDMSRGTFTACAHCTVQSISWLDAIMATKLCVCVFFLILLLSVFCVLR